MWAKQLDFSFESSFSKKHNIIDDLEISKKRRNRCICSPLCLIVEEERDMTIRIYKRTYNEEREREEEKKKKKEYVEYDC